MDPTAAVNRKFLTKWCCHVTGQAVNTEVACASHRPSLPEGVHVPACLLLTISQPQTAAQETLQALGMPRPRAGPCPPLCLWVPFLLGPSQVLQGQDPPEPRRPLPPPAAGRPFQSLDSGLAGLAPSGLWQRPGLAKPVLSLVRHLHIHRTGSFVKGGKKKNQSQGRRALECGRRPSEEQITVSCAAFAQNSKEAVGGPPAPLGSKQRGPASQNAVTVLEKKPISPNLMCSTVPNCPCLFVFFFQHLARHPHHIPTSPGDSG